MSITLYRGDDREPTRIRQVGGFEAWVQLTVPTVRQLITRVAIDPRKPVTLPAQLGHLSEFLRNWPADKLVGVDALYQEIRRETSHTTVHVSTDRTEGAGGRSVRYLYRIVCPVPDRPLFEWPSSGNYSIAKTGKCVRQDRDLSTSRVRTFLLTDTGTDPDAPDLSAMISQAEVVAVYKPAPDAGEVAFLTGVPLAWITHFKPVGAQDWAAM